jgi:hypothetical protein
MSQPFEFDPDKVAYYEKAGWQAYYDRKWLRAFWLLVRLNRQQFRMSWLTALAAALDTVRASIAFAPLDGDIFKAQGHIERFYEKARRSLDIQTEAGQLAELEMNYWVIHRQLALHRLQTPEEDDIEPMIQALVALHAALFDASPEQLRPSAELRALAAKTVDDITGKRSTDVAADWRRVEEYLRQAYQAVRAVKIRSP